MLFLTQFYCQQIKRIRDMDLTCLICNYQSCIEIVLNSYRSESKIPFQEEYLTCSTTPEDWKKIEDKFCTRLNAPHAIGALDGKHIVMKKPKKSGSEYYNYKGFYFPDAASPG